MDNLSNKILHILDFNVILKNFIFILLDNFFEFYLDNKLRKKMFSLIIQKYYAKNIKNMMNLTNLLEYIYFFNSECKRRYNGDRNENNWISDDAINIVNEITKKLNSYNNQERH